MQKGLRDPEGIKILFDQQKLAPLKLIIKSKTNPGVKIYNNDGYYNSSVLSSKHDTRSKFCRNLVITLR